ncbi:50S ribosomal protein L4 [Anaerococcus hydrogenalis]|uniref:Large ribosomal subunit protein uL4 n=1 Tax=Anaerococcus hydrogenalis TaxID=33029 RepID=A0A2N6UIQ8_9FIRM|nr:50S ribosomal protein L4 [Anaerococcus hydrogenalis]MBS5988186.1 50S ribosomal protein L4 [Anaerococcus hydrogenalis]MDK7694811.1 50S ribosomal protein L4 [Anaerococcus hydrogenalis]MDK7696635.1 50S ribosomal protein L4 [Anaerococcus hydrogenalis]MDK7707838.1 50S ribosomal protein L4 [Anaerococcus hydrogenalis]PMC81447.1 50S ribosomal protein L4 [Anaerococcus hydrogenalis]
MPKVEVLNIKGENVGEIELNETLFAADIAETAVYDTVKNQLANKRQGTQSAKTRSEVRGGGRKPFRQKGTGRARQGSIRAPHYTGGGIVFAPKPRDYSYKIPKKMKRKALYSVLTSKVNDNELVVLDELKLDSYKTKEANEILTNIKADKKAYVVIADNDDKVYRSFRNIEGCDVEKANLINVYDLLRHNKLVITKEAIAKLEEVFI